MRTAKLNAGGLSDLYGLSVQWPEPASAGALHPDRGRVDDLVEVWFGIIERRAVCRGTFRSVRELSAKIRTFIDGGSPTAPTLDQDC